jgi:chloramphenicol-sensitive protein RarD
MPTAADAAPLSPPALAPADSARETRLGVAYGASAYLWWGLSVLYFKSIAHVSALEILAHRIAWSVPLLLAWIAWRGRLGAVRAALTSRRTVLTLLATTTLIATNWLLFVVAVSTGHVVEASLGYYINPLVNVLFGMLFLGERLRPAQWASVILAGAGVTYLAATLDRLPLVALVLAVTFGLYGLLRKTVPADGPTGLAVETSLLFPAALGFLGFHAVQGDLAFGHGISTTVLLLLAGVATTLPLLWFTNAVRRLRLATVGFLQYLSPTLQLLLAVALYGEPFTQTHLVTFACIWTALANYSADAWRHR